MSQTSELQYQPNQDQWTKLQSIAKAKGFNLDSNEGTTDYDGITFGYKYDPITGYVTITTLKKPFYLKQSTIEQHIAQLYEQMYHS